MSETPAKDENVWTDRVLKLVIVFFVFPIVALVFHLLLTFPTLLVDYLLTHFGGNPELWAKILSAVTVLVACGCAIAVCKWIWPRSK
jgi:ABC-type uncharacterized transport system permease subunit